MKWGYEVETRCKLITWYFHASVRREETRGNYYDNRRKYVGNNDYLRPDNTTIPVSITGIVACKNYLYFNL